VHEDTDTIFEALSCGASGYLLKPVRAQELIAAVRDVSGGGAPMSSSIARKVVQSFQLSQPNDSATSSLSERERKVLELLARGYAYKEIGEQMGITVPTVGTHVRHIYDKLHVNNRAQAVAKLRSPSAFF